VRIFTMSPIWNGDETVFREMRPLEPSKWAGETLQEQMRGDPLKMIWAVDSARKPEGDLIVFPSAGVAAKQSLIHTIKRFAPNNAVNKIVIDGDDRKYGLLGVNNYASPENNMPHIFMMFAQYKKNLVTESFKSEWEKHRFTGAVFTQVTEIPNTRFIDTNTLEK
jgi:hypothetical protein